MWTFFQTDQTPGQTKPQGLIFQLQLGYTQIYETFSDRWDKNNLNKMSEIFGKPHQLYYGLPTKPIVKERNLPLSPEHTWWMGLDAWLLLTVPWITWTFLSCVTTISCGTGQKTFRLTRLTHIPNYLHINWNKKKFNQEVSTCAIKKNLKSSCATNTIMLHH